MQDSLTLFDRNKPFYPFIMSFYASVHGSLDFIARHNQDNTTSPYLLGESLELSSLTGEIIEINWRLVARAFFENREYVTATYYEIPLRMLLLSCYEVCLQHYDAADPVWRFFKHCRNAAAHDGYFYLVKRNGELPVGGAKTAIWKTKEVQMFMDGDPLLVDEPDKNAFLRPGDVLELLHDIEAKF